MFESFLIVFVGFAGFLLSLFLFHKKRAKSEPFVCPLHGKCSEVIHSGYSKFLGMPVEILGMIYYVLISLGHGLLLALAQTSTWLEIPLLIASTAAFLFSLYLTFIQIVALRKLCTWCLLSAAFCFSIFILTILGTLDFVLPLLLEYRSIIILLHILSMSLGLGAATLTDVFFLKFLKDTRISENEADVLSTFSEFIWLALSVVVITGFALYLPQSASYSDMPNFLAKMVVVGIIILNGAFLNLYITPKLMRISFAQPHHHKKGELGHARRIAFALGPISIVSWYTAFILSFIPTSASFSFWMFLKLYAVAVIFAMTIGQFVEHRLSKMRPPWVNP